MTGGVSLEVDMSSLQKAAKELTKRFEKKIVLQKAGDYLQQSIRYNFVVGGRPTRWKPLNYRIGQPLRDTNRLMNSITSKVRGDKAYVGTNVKYAPTHNFGAKKGQYGKKNVTVPAHSRKRGGKTYSVRSHSRKMSLPWGDIPKREFMIVQNEDVLEIERILKRLAEG